MTQYPLTKAPQRQFSLVEFEHRMARAQAMIIKLNLDGVYIPSFNKCTLLFWVFYPVLAKPYTALVFNLTCSWQTYCCDSYYWGGGHE